MFSGKKPGNIKKTIAAVLRILYVRFESPPRNGREKPGTADAVSRVIRIIAR